MNRWVFVAVFAFGVFALWRRSKRRDVRQLLDLRSRFDPSQFGGPVAFDVWTAAAFEKSKRDVETFAFKWAMRILPVLGVIGAIFLFSLVVPEGAKHGRNVWVTWLTYLVGLAGLFGVMELLERYRSSRMKASFLRKLEDDGIRPVAPD